MREKEIPVDESGYCNEIPVGYWRRGDHQYWHIKQDCALLINLSKKGYHYDGDGQYIFFKDGDSTIRYHVGRQSICKEEFEKVKGTLIKRILNFK